MSLRRRSMLVAAFVVSATSGRAGATGPGNPEPTSSLLELAWRAPPDCPDEASVRRQVEVYLGGPPRRALRAAGEIAAQREGFVLRLDIEGARKQFRARSCEDLGRAAAIGLSIAIDPDAGSLEPEPAATGGDPAPPPSPVERRPAANEPPRNPAPSLERPKAAPPRSTRRLRGSVRAEAGFQYGIGPRPEDVSLAVGLVWPRARFEIAGTIAIPGLVDLGDDRSLRVTLGAVEARGCGTLTAWRFEFPLCGGVEFGTVRLDEVPGGRTRHRLYSGVSASAALVWPFHRLVALWVGPEVIVTTSRSNTSVFDGSARYRVGPAAIRGFVGLEVRFP